jgi:predicted nucleic acid-binding protein
MTLLDHIPINALIGLDTAPCIYWLEYDPVYYAAIQPLFQLRIDRGLNSAVTSVVSLAEALVKPLATARTDLADNCRVFFTNSSNLTLVPISDAIAELAADLRVRYSLRLPDAFQIAAALDHGATYFVTNDAKMRRVTELTVLLLKDYLPPHP